MFFVLFRCWTKKDSLWCNFSNKERDIWLKIHSTCDSWARDFQWNPQEECFWTRSERVHIYSTLQAQMFVFKDQRSNAMSKHQQYFVRRVSAKNAAVLSATEKRTSYIWDNWIYTGPYDDVGAEWMRLSWMGPGGAIPITDAAFHPGNELASSRIPPADGIIITAGSAETWFSDPLTRRQPSSVFTRKLTTRGERERDLIAFF